MRTLLIGARHTGERPMQASFVDLEWSRDQMANVPGKERACRYHGLPARRYDGTDGPVVEGARTQSLPDGLIDPNRHEYGAAGVGR